MITSGTRPQVLYRAQVKPGQRLILICIFNALMICLSLRLYSFIGIHINPTNIPGTNLIWTNFFSVPWLTCVKNILHPDKNETRTINLSDHEAVTSHLYLFKPLSSDILNKLFNFFHSL